MLDLGPPLSISLSAFNRYPDRICVDIVFTAGRGECPSVALSLDPLDGLREPLFIWFPAALIASGSIGGFMSAINVFIAHGMMALSVVTLKLIWNC